MGWMGERINERGGYGGAHVEEWTAGVGGEKKGKKEKER